MLGAEKRANQKTLRAGVRAAVDKLADPADAAVPGPGPAREVEPDGEEMAATIAGLVQRKPQRTLPTNHTARSP
ncbi:MULTISPECIES: hypothetical protein [unclassified Saccharothrix]|uniref:hypothetical protein n=1 Tax=unclassified Saccharothrix TaxID=2593673 RepID=UPI00307F9C3C